MLPPRIAAVTLPNVFQKLLPKKRFTGYHAVSTLTHSFMPLAVVRYRTTLLPY